MNLKKVNLKTMVFSEKILDENTGEIITPYIDDIMLVDFTAFSFPVIYDDTGRLWEEGVLFITHYANTYGPKGIPEPSTVNNMADALVLFINWANTNKINIFHFSFPTPKRPTYQYGFYLKTLIENGKITNTTAIDRFNKVKEFYKWSVEDLVVHKKFNPEFAIGFLWKVKQQKINFEDNRGTNRSKYIESTDISESLKQAVPKPKDNLGTINDGGKLRPLSPPEQEKLFQELSSRGNIEMKLAHEIAIVTGARLSSVFTLRANDFLDDLREGQKEYNLQIGAGTDIKNKNQKNHTLTFPSRLYYKLQTYVKSERYLKKLKKCLNKFKIYTEEKLKGHPNLELPRSYLFITSNGQPYYIHSKACFYSEYFNKPPNGNSVNQFTLSVSDSLAFRYRFHDLRATCGMNIVRSNEKNLNTGKVSYLGVLEYVKKILGHESTETSERYLKFEFEKEVRHKAQDSYENFIENIVD